MRKLLLVALATAAMVSAGARPSAQAQSGDCEVNVTEVGSMVSVCPGADTFEEFLQSFSLSLFRERVADDTAPLRIESVPSGASVWIDGELFGTTPLRTGVEPGSRFVQVLAPGYDAMTRQLTVPPRGLSDVFTLQQTVDTSLLDIPASNFTGLPGFDPSGDLWVERFIRDRDGVLYVHFLNRTYKAIEFGGLDTDTSDGTSSPPRSIQTEEAATLEFNGVAKSEDDGATWELVFSLSDEFEGTGSTSEKLVDRLFASEREDDEPEEHWAKIYFKERHTVSHSIETIMPHPDGGVIIRYFSGSRTSRQVDRVWDNVGYIREFYQKINEPAPERAGLDFSDPSRWGTSESEIAEESTSDGQWYVVSPGHFDPTPVQQNDSGSPYEDFRYQGTIDGVHYWYSHEPTGSGRNVQDDGRSRFIYSSEDDGRTINQIAEFEREAKTGPVRREELRISPDGDFYVLDQLDGTLHRVGDGVYELVNRIPDEFWVPPDQSLGESPGAPVQALAFDEAGNMHLAVVRYDTPLPRQGGANGYVVYYQFIPKKKPGYDGVALFTGQSCAVCPALREFLIAAGIEYTENPELPSSERANFDTVVGATGYPVVDRVSGNEHFFVNGNDRVAVATALGASYPSYVDGFIPRRGTTGQGALWAYVVLDGGSPRIITERSDGFFAYRSGDGGWEADQLFASPSVRYTRESPTQAFYSAPEPYLPGSHRTYAQRQIDVDFNAPDDLDGLRMLYLSSAVSTNLQVTSSVTEEVSRSSYYVLGSKGSNDPGDNRREIMTVSQLIPAATFYVRVPDDAAVNGVSGELLPYVTDQGITTIDGGRYYRVVADLRAGGETAVNGNLMSRMIGGYIQVTVDDETTPFSLFLDVDNTRLTVFDPISAYNTVDLTMEAVHFEDGRWIITNNLALTNSIECGNGRVIAVGPNTYTTVTPADDADSAALDSCLHGIETDPLNIPNCDSWDDAKLVLTGELIATLANSLPLHADQQGVVNYVQAFGSARFTGHRVVNVAKFAAELGCTSEIAADPVVVVRIEGDVLADGDVIFQPTISIVEHGSAAAVDRPATGRLNGDQEIAWLEFEAEYLESVVRQLRNASVDARFFGSAAGRRIRYLRDLNAVHAALHCSRMGTHVDELAQFLNRTAEYAEGTKPLCLRDFFQSPGAYWPTLNSIRTLGTRNIDVVFPGVLVEAFEENPTMAFLKASAVGSQRDWESHFVEMAQFLESRGGADDVARQFYVDLALDVYGRIRTRLIRDNMDWRFVLSHAVLFLNEVQLDIFDGTMANCLETMGQPAPLAYGREHTPAGSAYRAGIPCVDAFETSVEREEEFRRFGLGLRDPFFTELIKKSNNDLDLLIENLRLVEEIIPDLRQRTQGLDPARLSPAAVVSEDTDALDLLVMVHLKMKSLAESKAVFIESLVPGMTRCGVGMVRGLWSHDAQVFYATTGVAFVLGPLTGGASWGVAVPAMAGAGVLLAGTGVYDLAQQWNNLSEVDRISAACQATFGGLMAINGVASAYPVYARYNASSLRIIEPRAIDTASVQRQAPGSALALSEQLKLIEAGEGRQLVTRNPAAAVINMLRPSGVRGLLSGASKTQQVEILSLADKFEYEALPASSPERAVFETIVDTIKTNNAGNDVAAVLAARTEQGRIASLGNLEATATAWQQFGGTVAVQLAMNRGRLPSSISVFVENGTLVGSDASIIRAIVDGGAPSPLRQSGGFGRFYNDLLVGYAQSKRFQDFVRNPGRRGEIFTSLELNSLLRLSREAFTDLTASERTFFLALNRPDVAVVVNRAIQNAAQDLGVSVGNGDVLTVGDIKVSFLSEGAFKMVDKIEVSAPGAQSPIELVIKNGGITPEELTLLTELGELGITAKQYGGELVQDIGTTLTENGVQTNAISVEEFIPGDTWADLARSAGERGPAREAIDVRIAEAIGSLDGRLFQSTYRQRTEGLTGYYNRDLHWGNIKVMDNGSGQLAARIVDYDGTPKFHRLMTEEQYYMNTMTRRHLSLANNESINSSSPTQEVSSPVTEAYLRGMMSGFEQAGGERAHFIDVMRQTGANLRDPAAYERLLTPEERPLWQAGFMNSHGPAIANVIDSFLAEVTGQSYLMPDEASALAVVWRRDDVLAEWPVAV